MFLVGRALARACALLSLCGAATACSSGSDSSHAAAEPALEVVFTPSGGTFATTQTVALSTDPGAEIHYTLDGSEPGPASPSYATPLLLVQSTRLRARAMIPGPTAAGSAGGASGSAGMASTAGSAGMLSPPAREGAVYGSRYFKLAADSVGFASNLPIAIIHTFESGKLDAQGMTSVPADLEILEASGGVSHLLGSATVDTRIGIHVRGETSRGFSKKQYAIELWKEAKDQDNDEALLGMPAGSDWVISDPIAMDRSLIRNALAYGLSNAIGRYAPRTRFVEVYLVDSGGELSQANFLGLYTLMEKPKRGSARVNVQPLSAGTLAADLTGGYLLRIDKGTNDFQAAGKGVQFVYPDGTVMSQPARKPHLDYIQSFINTFGAASQASDFKAPATGQHYSELIDVDAFIDHDILCAMLKNVDGLRISTYFYKDREGKLGAGPIWDFDRSAGTPYDDRAVAPEEWKRAGSDGTDYFKEGWWGPLFNDKTFRTRYAQRFTQFLNGPMSAANLTSAVDRLSSEVGAAADRDFKRWTDTPPKNGSYATELSVLKDFLSRRAAWIQTQLPTFP